MAITHPPTCDPTPTGMWSNSAWASCSLTGPTSASVRLVRMSRTPQLMSVQQVG